MTGRHQQPLLYDAQFRRSSAVEQLTVNQLVVGSIPTAGAKKSQENKAIRQARESGFRPISGLVIDLSMLCKNLSSAQNHVAFTITTRNTASGSTCAR
jgi:hypothetical protein